MDYLAVDLGAESGRVVLGRLKDQRLALEVLHRFPNRPVWLPDGLHWDVLDLFNNIKDGLFQYRQHFGTELASISCDSWGVDFGLLDKEGGLLSNPYHYRNQRTGDLMEAVCQQLSPALIYQETGIQFMPINTIYQLVALARSASPLLAVSDRLLMIADLFHYFLSGEKIQEVTLATTSQLYNPVSNSWSKRLLECLNLPERIMPPTVSSASVVGSLRSRVAEEVNLPSVKVVAGASHDTAAAVAACPAKKGERYAYLSSGTWSLLGVELAEPLIKEAAREAGFTNEGGVGGTTCFLHNITGLWLLQ